MAKTPAILKEEDRFDLTPMIDVVFLMLIYFMVTSTLIKQEADFSITLPAPPTDTAPPEQYPSEHFVQVLPDGTILLNGAPMDNPESRGMPQLTRTLSRLKQSADSAGIDMYVTIDADDLSPHQRSIDALNACALARVKFVSFAMRGE